VRGEIFFGSPVKFEYCSLSPFAALIGAEPSLKLERFEY